MKIEDRIQQAEAKLSKIDPELGTLISRQGTVIHHPQTNYFYSLTRSIIGQQVSVAAANAMFNRLAEATDLQPTKVSQLTDEEIKSIGLSRQKASYILDLANHFVIQPDIYNHLETQTDQQVIEELTAVKGIGIWTAQMFLMFTLTRLDVFAPADVGIQRAMKQFYRWEYVPPPDELNAIAEKWKPYRTIACWHLWEFLKNAPT